MEQKEIHITYSQFGSVEEMNAEDRELVSESIKAMGGAYAPYSHFHVGAAVRLSNGQIVRVPTRRMRLSLRDSVQRGPQCSPLQANTPTKICSA